MTLVEDILDNIEEINSNNIIQNDDLSEQISRTITEDHEIPDEFVGPSFPKNPFLEDAQTANGGLFANLGGGTVVPLQEGQKMSKFPTGDGSQFGLDGQFMQPVYANITDGQITVDVESIDFGPNDLALSVGPYNETVFGTDDQWYRIPTGIGTPYPLDPPETAWDPSGTFQGDPILGGPDGDYLLKKISGKQNGFEIVWEYLGENQPAGTQTTRKEVVQDPEDDAEAFV